MIWEILWELLDFERYEALKCTRTLYKRNTFKSHDKIVHDSYGCCVIDHFLPQVHCASSIEVMNFFFNQTHTELFCVKLILNQPTYSVRIFLSLWEIHVVISIYTAAHFWFRKVDISFWKLIKLVLNTGKSSLTNGLQKDVLSSLNRFDVCSKFPNPMNGNMYFSANYHTVMIVRWEGS